MAALVGEAVMKIYVGCKLTYECIIRDLFSVNKSRIREISITSLSTSTLSSSNTKMSFL